MRINRDLQKSKLTTCPKTLCFSECSATLKSGKRLRHEVVRERALGALPQVTEVASIVGVKLTYVDISAGRQNIATRSGVSKDRPPVGADSCPNTIVHRDAVAGAAWSGHHPLMLDRWAKTERRTDFRFKTTGGLSRLVLSGVTLRERRPLNGRDGQNCCDGGDCGERDFGRHDWCSNFESVDARRRSCFSIWVAKGFLFAKSTATDPVALDREGVKSLRWS
jgi:hypothetical protein